MDIAPRVDGPAVPHTGHGIEMAISGASGEDGQTVGAGGPRALRAGLIAWGLASARADDDDASSLNSRIRAGFSGISLGLDVMF